MSESDDRKTLIDRLERAISEPPALVAYLTNVLDTETEGVPSDLDEGRLRQVLEDGARLDVLDDDELHRLATDPAALVSLGYEVVHGAWPAWDVLLDGPAEGPSRPAPGPIDWDRVEALAAQLPTDDELPAGSFGTVLDAPFDAAQRAWVLDWTEPFPLDALEWARTDPGAASAPAEGRGLIEVELRAFTGRRDNPGTWVLTLGGAVPKDRDVLLTVELFGWGLNLRDHSQINAVGGRTLPIELTGFGDLTGVFEGEQSDGATLRIECAGERQHWRLSRFLPGPVVNANTFKAWEHDRIHGYVKCFNKLSQRIESTYRGVDGPTEAEGAIKKAAAEILRQRYRNDRYANIRTLADLSNVISARAWLRFRGAHRLKSTGETPTTLDHVIFDLPNSGDAPDRRMYLETLTEELMSAIGALSPEQREAVALRDLEGESYARIAEVQSVPEGTARKRRFDGVRKLKKELENRGFHEGMLGGL